LNILFQVGQFGKNNQTKLFEKKNYYAIFFFSFIYFLSISCLIFCWRSSRFTCKASNLHESML